MGKGRLLAIGLTMALVGQGSRASAAADDPPPERPRWYGWQPLIFDTVATMLFVVAGTGRSESDGRIALVAPGLLAYVMAGPVIHGAHGRGWVGIGDLAMRLGLPLLLAAATASSATCSGGYPGATGASIGGDGCSWPGGGLVAGFAIAVTVDAFALSWEPRTGTAH